MKKILILSTILLIIFLIYSFFRNETINYISIGDSLIKGVNPYNIEGYGYNNYVKNYLERNSIIGEYNNSYYNSSIIGLIEDIKNNRTIIDNNKEYFIKKILRESDVVIISIGMDELSFNFKIYDTSDTKKNFDIMYTNIITLIKEIKKYAYNEIVFIGYYNPSNHYTSETDELFYYINDKLSSLMKDNNIKYIDIYENIKSGNYLDNPNSHHINTLGHLKIANQIISLIEKEFLT